MRKREPLCPSSATNWAYLCEDTAIERSLLIAGLPPMSEWPYVEGGPNRFHVGDNVSETVYQVIAWDTPVESALCSAHSGGPNTEPLITSGRSNWGSIGP